MKSTKSNRSTTKKPQDFYNEVVNMINDNASLILNLEAITELDDSSETNRKTTNNQEEFRKFMDTLITGILPSTDNRVVLAVFQVDRLR
jgi:hypothetical protein